MSSLQKGSFTVVTGRGSGPARARCCASCWDRCRLQGGELRWNGRPKVEDTSEVLVPPRVAYTSQVPRLFSEELRGNILLGLPENRCGPAAEPCAPPCSNATSTTSKTVWIPSWGRVE